MRTAGPTRTFAARRFCLHNSAGGSSSGPERDHPAETPDEFEYLCCKALAHDTPTSFEGVSVGGEPANVQSE